MATIKQLQTLFSKLGVEKTKREERIKAWTRGRTETSKELQEDELQELCDSLKSELNKQKQILEDAKRQRRSNILAIATRTGIKHPNNWDSFNHFMLHKSCVKKSLRLCDFNELQNVFIQLKAIEQSNAISAQKAGTKAYFEQLGMPKPHKN